jgi:DNA polymerase V
MIFHVDGNSFYASCERVFRPDLSHAPIAVLSNNDGIIISLNDECRALGIERGEVYHKIKKCLKDLGVAVFSSNYTLYADICVRMNNIYARYAIDVEMYSIDESFLFFPPMKNEEYRELAFEIKGALKKETGIPVSIGAAPTKTLAKVCNKFAKSEGGVCLWWECDQDGKLREFPASSVWGVGRSKAKFLERNQIVTALDLKNYPLFLAKKYLSITGFYTVRELNGFSHIEQKAVKTRQSVMCSQSFSGVVFDFERIAGALSDFTQESVKRLRDEKLTCRHVAVFLRDAGGKRYHFTHNAICELLRPTSYLPDILKAALELLHSLYCENVGYHKVLVLLTGLERQNRAQSELFDDDVFGAKKKLAMNAFDEINRRYGRNALHTAVSDLGKQDKSKWRMRREMVSPAYTTKLSDVPSVK